MCSLTLASGSIVRLSAKSLPVPPGNQAEGMAPFGKYKNALRKGAPVAVVAASLRASAAAANTRPGINSKAGKARHTPRLRRKRRRLKLCDKAVLEVREDDEFMAWFQLRRGSRRSGCPGWVGWVLVCVVGKGRIQGCPAKVWKNVRCPCRGAPRSHPPWANRNIQPRGRGRRS